MRSRTTARRGATVLTVTALAAPVSVALAERATAAPIPAPGNCASIGTGSRGPVVRAIQAIVGATPDGDFGPKTAAAVRSWQARHHLRASGAFDAGTWATLPMVMAGAVCGQSVTLGPGTPLLCPTVSRGSIGPAVSVIQRRLALSADGRFGPLTDAGVRNFQHSHHLGQTGRVDPATWHAAGLLGSAACQPASAPAHPAPPALAAKPVSPPVSVQQRIAAQTSAGLAVLHQHPSRTASAPRALAFAYQQIGVPYRYGGTTRAGYDCSGLMLASYAANGLAINRTAGDQYTGGRLVPLSDLRPGDLVFYAANLAAPATIYHDAMYAGGGQMIEAPHTGANVRLVPLRAAGLLPLAARPAALLELPARTGSHGFTVRQIQTRLVAHGLRIAIDGDYGPQTAGAVAAVQRAAHLPASGAVDWTTWTVLVR